MIDPKHEVSITRQSELLGISRAAVYYVPRPISQEDLVLQRRIDELHVKRAELTDFRFHDLRYTWASWHRQAGTSTDELKDLGGWKSRVMVDRYAKFATEHLSVVASRIESDRPKANVVALSRYVFATVEKSKKA